MSDETSNIRLRIPNALLAKVSEIAGKNRRSVNAEILARLQEAFAWQAFDPNALAGELDEIDRRFALLFTHLGLLDLGEDPRVDFEWPKHEPKGKRYVKDDEPEDEPTPPAAPVSKSRKAAVKKK